MEPILYSRRRQLICFIASFLPFPAQNQSTTTISYLYCHHYRTSSSATTVILTMIVTQWHRSFRRRTSPFFRFRIIFIQFRPRRTFFRCASLLLRLSSFASQAKHHSLCFSTSANHRWSLLKRKKNLSWTRTMSFFLRLLGLCSAARSWRAKARTPSQCDAGADL